MRSWNVTLPSGNRMTLESDTPREDLLARGYTKFTLTEMPSEYELHKHLRKCELEWRAKNLPNGCCVDWLAPECDSLEHIAAYLQELGFKIREIMDYKDCMGEKQQWVETASGILVFQNDGNLKGFMCLSAKKSKK